MAAITKQYRWLLPLICFVIYAPFSSTLDLTITRYFFHEGYFAPNSFAKFFYYYGCYLADSMGGIGLLVLLGSLLFKKLIPLRKPSTMLFLMLAIGSGLIINGIFKEFWGRPRPVQTIEFGGPLPFRPFYQPNFHSPIPAKSFPCGHCSCGFYFFALVILGKRYQNKAIYYLGIALTLFMGFSLSYARLTQGGHYFSDIVGAALVMWLTVLSLDWLLFQRKEN